MKFFLILFCLLVSNAHAACTLSGSVAFGVYSPFISTPNDSSGLINVNCGINILVTVNISPGQSGTYGERYLSSGTEKLYYNLYTNAQRTIIFGDASNGTSNFSSLVLLQTNIPVYARICAQQNVGAGFYRDTPTVSVIF